uniref:Cell cycle checkpoint protein RAD17 n=1 Tax=Monodelphis domestica TaxID=13616 RepID=A0A5F8HGW4_MONDO
MSKTSLRRKVASTKITNWVEPSFDDFVANTDISSALKTESLGVNNFHQRRKDLPSTLESSKFIARKKGKSSSKHISVEANFNENLSENEPWVDKYKPETQNELAVHKKKIEELETWLKAHVFEWQPKQGGPILIITGPPGCGKTATLQILVKELGIEVQEWINPVFLNSRKHDMKDGLNLESSFHMVPSQSQMTIFQEFLLRANKYNKLQMLGDCLHTDKKIILIEDLPNQFYRDPSTLHEILRTFVRLGRCPLIFIISDSLSGASSQRLLFPKEIQEECSISNISFNPVAPTIMMKVLSRIAAIEANMNGGKIAVPEKPALELLCKGCSGDIRSAINSLQFSSFKGNSEETNFWSRKKGMSSLKSDALLSKARQRKRPDSTSENQEVQAIGGKDACLFLFRALGKILYCKRTPLTELEFPRLPPHLSEYERDVLLVEPEEVIEKSHMPAELFNLYLHQNYVDFFTEIEDLVRASEYMSSADVLCGDWNSRTTLGEYSASVATRGVMHSNKSRGFAYCQGGGASFRPLHKPQWFLINRKVFYSPFPAQIAFIQDVGRLPLRRFFGRLKMEALTDKDSGMIDSNSDEEANLDGSPPTKILVHMDKIQPSETDAETSQFLPSSQTSGTDLPASQPQPATVQGFMEEEEITIEEYDSDEM